MRRPQALQRGPTMRFEYVKADDRENDARAARDEELVRWGLWPKAKRLVAKLPFAEDLLAAYYCAFDRNTPRHVQAALIGALAYFVLPFDVMADIMPMLGFADDAAVLAAAIRLVAGHMTPQHREAARRALVEFRRV
jgi:uncharacterized membrane protein YkvA (DUF1232 family)